jgi:hypothetical protein
MADNVEKKHTILKMWSFHLIIVLYILLFSPIFLFGSNRLQSNQSVRYDLILSANFRQIDVEYAQIKVLDVPRSFSLKRLGECEKGNLRLKVFEMDSCELIYCQGFSPLFYEWLFTQDAKTTKKSFYQSFSFPKPDQNIILTLEIRDSLSNWTQIFIDSIHFDTRPIMNDAELKFSVDTLIFSGSPGDKPTVVFVSEGYTLDEMQKFVSDSRNMVDSLLSDKPFSQYTESFNFFALSVPSVESGCDEPHLGVYKNTALQSTFNTFDSPRYLTVSDMKALYDAVECLPWDYLVVLVNSSEYGGGGFYNFLSITTTDNPLSAFVFKHEFGHSFAGLADEYFYDSEDEFDYYTEGIEPWEQNITTLTKFGDKWEKMIEPGMPLPTPREQTFVGKIGLFEGGGYKAKGVYSPFMTCFMKEATAGRFCPVCESIIEKVILSY